MSHWRAVRDCFCAQSVVCVFNPWRPVLVAPKSWGDYVAHIHHMLMPVSGSHFTVSSAKHCQREGIAKDFWGELGWSCCNWEIWLSKEMLMMLISLQIQSRVGAVVLRTGACDPSLDWPPPGSTGIGCPGTGPACYWVLPAGTLFVITLNTCLC